MLKDRDPNRLGVGHDADARWIVQSVCVAAAENDDVKISSRKVCSMGIPTYCPTTVGQLDLLINRRGFD